MKKILWLVMLAFLSISYGEAQTREAFGYLRWVSLFDIPSSSYLFGYDQNTFHFDGRAQELLPNGDPLKADANYGNNEGSMNFYIGYFQRQEGAPVYHFFFSDGPSEDPTFYITDQNFNPLWHQYGEEMAVTEGGVIYLSGNVDRMFNMRMKFKMTSKGIIEIPQPYYYVGVKGELLKPIKLFSQKEGGEVGASLPKGYTVEVLLADPYSKAWDDDSSSHNRYLVRSDFGLVGWMRLEEEDMHSFFEPVIKGIGYLGD